MAPAHNCTNCQAMHTADRWLCDECQMAVNAAVMALGSNPNFSDVHDAGQRALAERARPATGRIADPMAPSR